MILPRKKIVYASHIFLLAVCVTYIVDLIFSGAIHSALVLVPHKVAANFQWHRIAAYPLVFSSLPSALLFFFVFLVFAPKIENIYRGWLYPLALLVLFVVQGVIVVVVLWDKPIEFCGQTGAAFFVLTAFTLINLKKKLVILNKFYMKTPIFGLSVLALWLASLYLHSIVFNAGGILIQEALSSTYGIIAGTIAFFNLKYAKSLGERSKETLKTSKPDMPTPEELSMAIIAHKKLKQEGKAKPEEDAIIPSENYFNEEKLNEILDKISEKGTDSLTSTEIRYLEEYSKNL